MGQVNAVKGMSAMDITVGRGSRTSPGLREGTALCTSLTCITPLCAPSRSHDVTNTIARPDQERPVPTITSGSANSSPQYIQGSNVTMTLRNRGSFGSLAYQ